MKLLLKKVLQALALLIGGAISYGVFLFGARMESTPFTTLLITAVVIGAVIPLPQWLPTLLFGRSDK